MILSLALTETMDNLVVQLVIQFSFHVAQICCMPSLSYGIPSNVNSSIHQAGYSVGEERDLALSAMFLTH